MSNPLFPHGITCGYCHKTLMAGGNDQQRPHERAVEEGSGTPWIVDGDAMIIELLCRQCLEDAKREPEEP